MNNKANKISYLCLHHSGGTDKDKLADTSRHTVLVINEWHKYRGFPKSKLGWVVGYHFVIEKSGKLIQTRGLEERGCHCLGINDKSCGILIMGNFDRPLDWQNSYPTKEQIITLKKLLRKLVDNYNIPLDNIVPHRRFSSKSCFGKNLQSTWGRNLLIDDPKKALKKKIAIIQAMIKIYVKLLELFKMKGRL